MKLLLFICMTTNVYRAEGALIAPPRQQEENLSPRFQALKDSGETLKHKVIQRAQSLRELKENNVIAALKNNTILQLVPRRNSVSEGSSLKNIPILENKKEN